MKKQYLLVGAVLICSFAQAATAATARKLAISASRANCLAVTPVGVGYHNESLSWDPVTARTLYVQTYQKARNQNVTRTARSSASYAITRRAYAGGVDTYGSRYYNTFWEVTGNHFERFSIAESYYTKTTATACNLSQGWPWS